MTYMWADSLMLAERAHTLRVLAWGASSVLVGTLVLAMIRVRTRRSALLEAFAWQTMAWGVACLLVGAAFLARLAPRDLSAATRLDRVLWLNIGLDGGYLLVGATLVVLGARLGRRLPLIGAGLAILVQGIALGLLDLLLAARISR